ncbi:MAG TPA: pilus assembly protein TadG-related protein [Thermomicrobiales bacterium]|nr:pilus assembly protein TadG-related protein [Thermomicrobiales bacterium]
MQRGQILIVTAAALLVLISVAALVVDLGFSWMLHRQEQNAADPAALAAARFIGDQDPVTGDQTFDFGLAGQAACFYAIQNKLVDPSNTNCDPALDPDDATVTVHYPPDATSPDFVGDTGHVQVIITKNRDTFFSRVFGIGRMTITAQAVAARVRGAANTHSLIALKPDGCSTAEVQGTALVHIYPKPGYTGPGGFVQVNANCGTPTSDDACGTSGGSGSLDVNGTADLYATKVNVHGSCKGSVDEPHGLLDEAASQVADPLGGLVFPSILGQPGARCGGPSAPQTASTGTASKGCGGAPSVDWQSSPCPPPSTGDCVTLDPGVYYGGWTIDNDLSVTLKPGIYVIAGGGIRFIGTSSLTSLAGTGPPAPVLIYNTDNPSQCPPSTSQWHCQDDLSLKADRLQLAGLKADAPCPPISTTGGCPFGGMVIWDDPKGAQGLTGSGLIHVEGNSELFISGTIYAPRSAVEILGTSSENTTTQVCPTTATQIAAVQIISWTWKIGGTGDVCMPYDPADLYKINRRGLVE